MNSNFRVATAALAGLQGLRWNAFSAATASSNYAQIPRPSFVVDHITTTAGFSGGGSAKNSISSITLTAASAGTVPAWCFPGAAVNVNVTLSGAPFIWGAVVKDVAANGTTVTLTDDPRKNSNLSTTLANVALDAIAGSVVNTVTLNTQCQKVMLSQPTRSGAITLAPAADAAGSAFYSITLAVGGAEYEVTAPIGAKFDICDWWFKSAAAQTLTVRFL